jgi:hypothetical protein
MVVMVGCGGESHRESEASQAGATADQRGPGANGPRTKTWTATAKWSPRRSASRKRSPRRKRTAIIDHNILPLEYNLPDGKEPIPG